MSQNADFSPPGVLFLTGVSGAGKSTILNFLAKSLQIDKVICLHFDSIGVPPETEMVQLYGSGRNWQKVMAEVWASRIAHEYTDKKLVIIEGQVDIQFVIDALTQASLKHQIILLHCEKATRDLRLRHDRKQANLANDDMENWAQYLKTQATQKNIQIINTTNITVEITAEIIKKLVIEQKLN